MVLDFWSNFLICCSIFICADYTAKTEKGPSFWGDNAFMPALHCVVNSWARTSLCHACMCAQGRGQASATKEAPQMRRELATGEGTTALPQHKINIFRYKKIRCQEINILVTINSFSIGEKQLQPLWGTTAPHRMVFLEQINNGKSQESSSQAKKLI